MSTAREIRRTFAIGAAVLLAGAFLTLASNALFCPAGHLAARAGRGEPAVVDSGYHFALAGESIFACTTAHRIGPLTLHDDLDCYCAPAATDARTLGERLDGVCTVDKAAPTRADAGGICRHAHCEDVEAP